jgi:succinyl-diaminopimelate desuccinylase
VPDLLDLATELVAVPSVSHHEAVLAGLVETRLRGAAHLVVERIDDTVVARTQLGRRQRVVLAGHLDTVPPSGDGGPRRRGDTLWGLGAVDMKGGVAVLLDLALSVAAPALDVTYVLYACEEVDRRHSGLARLVTTRPELLAADAAVLGEPTGGVVEAGCQGTMRAALTLRGRRAHTARPWTGVNAVHRLAPVLEAAARYQPRRVVLDGCEYAEQLQAVRIEGGVANNVVPDRATVLVNFRFAPDRSVPAAEAELRTVFAGSLDPGAGDEIEVVEVAPAGAPSLDHPLIAAVVAAAGGAPRAKLGWTDVATFGEIGVPAANFGPGDPLLAHTPDEHVSRHELEHARSVLAAVIG